METANQVVETTKPVASKVSEITNRKDTPNRRIFRRFRRNRLAVAGLILLTLIACSAIFAPLITSQSPLSTDLRALKQPPSPEHALGTDTVGRDVLARVLYGGRVSLAVGIGSVIIYVVLGIGIGLVAGFYGGWLDAVTMRVTDAIMSLPVLLLVLMLVTLTEPSLVNIIFAIAVVRWTGIARLVRGQVLYLRETDYVVAVRALGAVPSRIMWRHLLPNLTAPVIVAATFGIAAAILSEASLSFLGLGVRPPTPSWGGMLNEAQSFTVLATMPWFWIPPGAMIAACVLCINFIGDGLRDAMDPRGRYM